MAFTQTTNEVTVEEALDYEDEGYVNCPICDDEYTEDELAYTFDFGRAYIEGVCANCVDTFKRKLDDYLSEIEDDLASDFLDNGGSL